MSQRVLFAIGEMSGGGSQRQLLGILKHLDRGRFAPELYVVSPRGELLGEVPGDVPIHVFTERWQQPLGKIPGSGFRARVRDLARLLEVRRIDVLYDRTYHMTLITAAATRKRPTPRVSVIVTDPKRDFETNPERFRRIKRRLLWLAYRDADVVAAVSAGVGEAAADYHRIPPTQIETAYNFFDISAIDRLAGEDLPSGFTRRAGRFRIVAAGRLHPQKGFDVLIEAIRIVVESRESRVQKCSALDSGLLTLDSVELLILGSGEAKSQLEQQIRQAGLADHVRLAGFWQNPLPFYRTADLFCLPSRYEGMPNALVEAMLCGVPVLATDCPSGPREILQKGGDGRLVPVDDPQALATAIEDAITNQPLWQSLTTAARQQIIRRYSPPAGIERVIGLLEKAVARFRERGE